MKFILLAVAAAVAAHAHSVWIEPGKDGQLMIRFAEPDGKYEKSPGHLDKLETPKAWKSGEKGPERFEVQKKSDHFLIVGSKVSDLVQIETRFMVMAAPGKPGRLPNFYGRWNPDGAPGSGAALTLDLTPTGKPGEAKVMFRGKPLPEAKATFRTPAEKEETIVADKEGVLRFSSKLPGQYMLSVAHHRENLPGFAEGMAYELLSHNSTLTWVQP